MRRCNPDHVINWTRHPAAYHNTQQGGNRWTSKVLLIADALHMQRVARVEHWTRDSFWQRFHVPADGENPDFLSPDNGKSSTFDRWWSRFLSDLRACGVPFDECQRQFRSRGLGGGRGASPDLGCIRFTDETQVYVDKWLSAAAWLADRRSNGRGALADRVYTRRTNESYLVHTKESNS